MVIIIIILVNIWEGNFKLANLQCVLCIGKTCHVITKNMWWHFMFYLPLAPKLSAFSICLLRLYWKRSWEEESRLLQTDNAVVFVAFYCMMDWPYRWPFWRSWQTGGGDLIRLFVLISSDVLSASVLGGIQAQTRRPEERRHAIRLQVIIPTQSRVTHLCHKLLLPLSRLALQTVGRPEAAFWTAHTLILVFYGFGSLLILSWFTGNRNTSTHNERAP